MRWIHRSLQGIILLLKKVWKFNNIFYENLFCIIDNDYLKNIIEEELNKLSQIIRNKIISFILNKCNALNLFSIINEMVYI